MRRALASVVLLLTAAFSSPARDYAPGSVVPETAVSDTFFRSSAVPESVFARMQGRSYKSDCTIPLESLRYITVLHRDLDGRALVGEMVCNEKIAEDLLYIFRELFKASYPIERMVLVDEYGASDELSMEANNSSCFNFRFISGTTKVSVHGRGMAVDINPLYNPYLRIREKVVGGHRTTDRVVEPSGADRYTDRSAGFPYKIVRRDLCCRLFLARGFTWGGDWHSVKDWQHFEKE